MRPVSSVAQSRQQIVTQRGLSGWWDTWLELSVLAVAKELAICRSQNHFPVATLDGMCLYLHVCSRNILKLINLTMVNVHNSYNTPLPSWLNNVCHFWQLLVIEIWPTRQFVTTDGRIGIRLFEQLSQSFWFSL